jgi:hypothetical protein
MRTVGVLLFIAVVGTAVYFYPRPSAFAPDTSVYAFTVTDIDNNTVPLREYEGKVLLITNVA